MRLGLHPRALGSKGRGWEGGFWGWLDQGRGRLGVSGACSLLYVLVKPYLQRGGEDGRGGMPQPAGTEHSSGAPFHSQER